MFMAAVWQFRTAIRVIGFSLEVLCSLLLFPSAGKGITSRLSRLFAGVLGRGVSIGDLVSKRKDLFLSRDSRSYMHLTYTT